MDSKIIQNQIDGLIEKGKKLREKERLFLKASGLNENIEKNKQEVLSLESEIAEVKEELAGLKAKKSDAVNPILMGIQDKINELLPEGEGIIHIENDGGLTIGWMLPNKPLVPYNGLSGGQKVIFGKALANALMNSEEKMLIFEAAEVDETNLTALLKQIKKTQTETQVIVNTWAKPKSVPKGWNLIELKNETTIHTT